MKRFSSMFLKLAAVAGLFACSDPTGVRAIKPDFDLSCAGVPNGGVTLITLTPFYSKIHYVFTPHSVLITAAVWRDDPNTPGDQVYCRDYNTPVTWTTSYPTQQNQRGWYLANIHAQDVTAISSGIGAGGTYANWVLGTASAKNDTAYVQSVY